MGGMRQEAAGHGENQNWEFIREIYSFDFSRHPSHFRNLIYHPRIDGCVLFRNKELAFEDFLEYFLYDPGDYKIISVRIFVLIRKKHCYSNTRENSYTDKQYAP